MTVAELKEYLSDKSDTAVVVIADNDGMYRDACFWQDTANRTQRYGSSTMYKPHFVGEIEVIVVERD